MAQYLREPLSRRRPAFCPTRSAHGVRFGRRSSGAGAKAYERGHRSGTTSAVSVTIARPSVSAPRTVPRWLYALPLPIVLIAAWQLACGGKSYSLIPPPSTVVLTVWDYAFGGIRNDTYSGAFAANAIASIIRVFSGFFVAMIVAIPLGLILGRSRLVRGLVDPTLQSCGHSGDGVAAAHDDSLRSGTAGDDRADRARHVLPDAPQHGGRRSAGRPRLIEAAEMLGTPKPAIFARVILPAASPSIFTGIRSASVLHGCCWSSVR